MYINLHHTPQILTTTNKRVLIEKKEQQQQCGRVCVCVCMGNALSISSKTCLGVYIYALFIRKLYTSFYIHNLTRFICWNELNMCGDAATRFMSYTQKLNWLRFGITLLCSVNAIKSTNKRILTYARQLLIIIS